MNQLFKSIILNILSGNIYAITCVLEKNISNIIVVQEPETMPFT